MKAQVDAIDHRIILLKNGDINNSVDITSSITNNTTKQGVNMENDTFQLTLDLFYSYDETLGTKTHQFTSNGKLIFGKNDIIREFVKRVDGEDIDITSRTDLIGEYFISYWSLSSSAQTLTLTMVDINYKIYNRLFPCNFGVKDGGTLTSQSGTTLTDTTQSWKVDVWKDNTVRLEDSDGRHYNYRIISNTATTLTIHMPVDSGLLTTYSIGESSPNVIHEAMLRATPSISFDGEYKLHTDYTTDYGGDYKEGIQIYRPDGYAFPIIEYSQANKAYYKMIREISSVDAVSTPYETSSQTNVINRDMVFSTAFNTEIDKYVVSWYYTSAVEKDVVSTVTSVGSCTITDTSMSMGVDEYKDRLIRINNKSYSVLSNSANVFLLSGSNIDEVVSVGDTYNIYSNVDFIWDCESDYRHIYDYKATNKTDGKVNHIFFSCGKNELNNNEVRGHLLNENSSDTTLTETYLPLTFIAKDILKQDGRDNGDGTYSYPSPLSNYLIHNDKGEPYAYAEPVSSQAAYNSNFKEICRQRAYNICNARFLAIKEGNLKITFTVRGNKYTQAGNATDKTKVYNSGSVIVFKDVMNGIYNEDQANGYYFLNVETVRHNITHDDWTTTIDCSVNYYKESELNKEL